MRRQQTKTDKRGNVWHRAGDGCWTRSDGAFLVDQQPNGRRAAWVVYACRPGFRRAGATELFACSSLGRAIDEVYVAALDRAG